MSFSTYWIYQKKEGNTLDHSMITQTRLELLYAQKLHEVEDIWEELSSENCQKDKIRTKIRLSRYSNLKKSLWRVKKETIHLERARGVVYFHG